MSTTKKIDFVNLYDRFNKLSPGEKAELRRASLKGELDLVSTYYDLIPDRKPTRSWERVFSFLPFVRHLENRKSLGEQLAKGDRNVREARLFLMLRSPEPNDLKQLQRMVLQVEPAVDWQVFGEQLYYWNKTNKRRIVEDYFMNKGES
mgnify:CR=1 FL=1|tara:strand:+ start:538 stop:981 length:444 start_codon:yes stop_codon:yes gene_type:complete